MHSAKVNNPVITALQSLELRAFGCVKGCMALLGTIVDLQYTWDNQTLAEGSLAGPYF